MAKFNIVYDSETKELSVDIDGTKLDNVQEVSAYKYYEGEGSICVGMGEKKGKVRYYSSVQASKSDFGKKAILDGTGLIVQDNVLILKTE